MFALTGRASDAVQTIAASIAAYRSTGSTVLVPFYLSHQARAHAVLGQLEDAERCINEALMAVETSGERWCEAGKPPHCRRDRIAIAQARRDESRPISSVRSKSPARNRPAPGSFARRRASRSYGEIRAGASKPMTSSRLSTVGSPKASTRLT